ncbi:hypothetical protein V5O48_012013 [Marasmius crinis-equi]|uniref:Uncharacterized protein n=1 Tax=Marasmius crinis-equi TaxID=585013 RepID=A0ABR3F4C2_9AGAR
MGTNYVYAVHSCNEQYATTIVEACKNKTITIPKGLDKDIAEHGIYVLEEGDMLWAHSLNAPEVMPEFNKQQIYVEHLPEYGDQWEANKYAMDALCDDFLGP